MMRFHAVVWNSVPDDLEVVPTPLYHHGGARD